MNEEEKGWYIGLSLVVGVAIGIVIVMQIINFYNEPERKAKRKLKAETKKKERSIEKVNSVNLNGLSMVKLSLNFATNNSKKFLYKEYKALIKRTLEKSKCHIQSIFNYKNLSNKFLPYEYNRVKLNSTEMDYINASWVDGFNMPKRYIASQIPLKGTIVDWLTMVWENHCQIIVMIGNEINHKHVFNYLNAESYSEIKENPFSFELVKSNTKHEFTIRIFRLKYMNKTRIIYHLQMQTWTLMNTPDPHIILECRRMIKVLSGKAIGPIIVHCITGCGRSGTFLAICNLCDTVDEIKESRQDQPISWAYEVIKIRESRINSIVNISQYITVYETLCHYIVSGVTVISSDELEQAMRFFSTTLCSGKTRFKRQFEDVNKMTKPLLNADCAGGIRLENLKKNRHWHVVPRDLDRPYLRKAYSNDTSDYINAVYVDSFNSKNHFIVTQWPMKSTINSVWRLTYEKDIKVMVILDALEDKTYPRFWSNILNQKFGADKVSVELTKDWQYNNSIRCQMFNLDKCNFELQEEDRRKLQRSRIKIIKQKMPTKVKSVLVMHLLNWKPKKEVPDSLKDFVDIIWLSRLVNINFNDDSKQSSPILVMSSDGFRRAGVFCATSACLEYIRQCNEVDVYNCVLMIKRNRPDLVTNMSEYMLIYELCLEYLSWSDSESQAEFVGINSMRNSPMTT